MLYCHMQHHILCEVQANSLRFQPAIVDARDVQQHVATNTSKTWQLHQHQTKPFTQNATLHPNTTHEPKKTNFPLLCRSAPPFFVPPTDSGTVTSHAHCSCDDVKEQDGESENENNGR